MIRSKHKSKAQCIAFAMVVGMAVGTALAHGPMPTDAPVDRLVANLTKYVAEHPQDADGYYRLGRVHTMALERKENVVMAWSEDDARPAEGYWSRIKPWYPNDQPTKLNAQELQIHLSEAIKNLNKAIELKPTDARYRLTLGCALEAGDSMKVDVGEWILVNPSRPPDTGGIKAQWLVYLQSQVKALAEDPEAYDRLQQAIDQESHSSDVRHVVMHMAYEFKDAPKYKEVVERLRRTDWHDQIEEQFFTAMSYGLPANGHAVSKPISGGLEDWVSYQAAKYYVRVVEARGARAGDQLRLRLARETIAAFDALPQPNAITPIVLSVAGAPLTTLISSSISRFDLEGSGRPQHWDWVVPDAGILVWDPAHTGKITSGRQLFGNASWWLFFENGYQALDALDDNRDGELAAGELDGIRVWFDRNSNGACEPGEVQDLDQLGIVGLATRATGMDGESPMNARGIRLAGGRVLPTYDWVAHAASESERTESGRVAMLASAAAVCGMVPMFAMTRRRLRKEVGRSGRGSLSEE